MTMGGIPVETAIITAIICLGIWWLIKKTRAHQQPKRETAPYDASAPYIPRQGLAWIFSLGELRQILKSDNPTDGEWRKLGVEFYRMMAEGSMGAPPVPPCGRY